MNPRLKTILIILGFATSVVVIGAGLYFAFFRGVVAPGPEPGEPVAEEPGVGLPESPEGQPPAATPPGADPGLQEADPIARGDMTQTTVLTEQSIGTAAVAADGLSFYDPADGRFYRVDEDGNAREISSARFPDAEDIAFNGTGDKAVIEFPDGSNVVYDFTTQSQVTLPRHWEDFEFSARNDQIVAKSVAIDPDNRWLVTSNADGSNVRAVQALGLNADKVIPSWSPNDSVVAFSDTGEPVSGGFDRKMILPIGKENENYRGLVIEGLGFLPEWSPDGKKLLYSTYSDLSENRPMVWATDATPATMGQNRRSLGLNTWADKCAFASNTVAYCAVPQGLPPNAGLQRTLYRNLPDHLYRLDISTGMSSIAAIPAEQKTMESLRVSADGSSLFFRNASTGQAEKIRLR